MKRTLLNLIVDVAAATSLLGMIATGYILRIPLPPGTNKSRSLWGLTRHCWGTVHFWISAALIAVLLVHVVLHWQWLVSVVAKRFGRPAPSAKRARWIGLLSAIVLVGVSSLFAWITSRAVQPITDAELFDVCPPTEDAQPARSAAPSAKPTFADDVQPILQRSCLHCHGPKRAAGGFRVDRKPDFFSQAHGGPLIVPGRSSASPLIAIVSGQRKDLPSPHRHKLPAENVAVLKRWIDGGAEWPKSGPE